MPSPFPGMDPYLENVIHWKSVHTNLITSMTYLLNDILPKAFVARTEVRTFVEPQWDLINPDAVTGSATQPLLFEYSELEVDEPYLTLCAADDGRIVTSIEILSPANKDPESAGRDEYLRKQKQVLRGDTHLVEIDLLRSGKHTIAVGRDVITVRRTYDYLVSVRRASAGKNCFEVWTVGQRDPLPRIKVPLSPDGTDVRTDVTLDLQAVLNTAYEGGRWRKRLNYERDPEPPLSPADAIWADAMLREKGLRP